VNDSSTFAGAEAGAVAVVVFNNIYISASLARAGDYLLCSILELGADWQPDPWAHRWSIVAVTFFDGIVRKSHA
jgi:hypothetical protein